MRVYDEKEQAARRRVQEDRIRAIVREEIVAALGALAREADHLDMPYETGELESSALNAIGKAAEGAVKRLTCPHEAYYTEYAVSKCARCGEPAPAPVNPFEAHEHTFDTSEGQPTDCIDCGAPYSEEKTNGAS